MTSLGERIAGSRENNLNAVRLFLALAVILSHAFPVCFGRGGEANGEPLLGFTHGQETFGGTAVDLFFLLSGMLITASWLRSETMQDYLMKRVLRIYPAFIVAVAFSGVMGLVFCPEFRAGLGNGVSWAFSMAKDWALLTENSLVRPEIFAHNPFAGDSNASLWTIQKEFACYLMVAVIGLFALFKQRRLTLLATVICLVLHAKALWAVPPGSQSDHRFLTYYLTGMSCWLWRDKIPFSKWIAFGSVAGLLIASRYAPWFSALFPILAGYCVLWVGYGPSLPFLHWTAGTDLSYGTYLYAFPVQQLAAMNVSLRNPWINVLIAVPVTLALAWCSWHVVEKRFLRMKKVHRNDFDPGTALKWRHERTDPGVKNSPVPAETPSPDSHPGAG